MNINWKEQTTTDFTDDTDRSETARPERTVRNALIALPYP